MHKKLDQRLAGWMDGKFSLHPSEFLQQHVRVVKICSPHEAESSLLENLELRQEEEEEKMIVLLDNFIG